MNAEGPRTIGDRYVLHDELASGGMATVRLGKLIGAAGFSRTVAIKRLHPQFAKDPEFVSMFIDEARIAARIRHPNVVATLDTVSFDGELFLVMEFVLGESLSKLTRPTTGETQPSVPVDIAVAILVGALHGLHAAHEATDEHGADLEVVHRDVSPQNVLVGVDGVSRVLDFGVAKALGRLQTTHQGQVKGKVAYMAPEQLRAQSVDRRTDVYAASVVLWEVLTGRRLFVSHSPGETMARVLEQPVEPPSKYAKGIPAALDEVVMRGLRRDPNQRFATAEEMAIALEAVVTMPTQRTVARWVKEAGGARITRQSQLLARIDGGSHPLPAPPQSPPGDKDAPSQITISLATELDPPRRAPHRRTWLVAGAAAVALMTGVLSVRTCRRVNETTSAVIDAPARTLVSTAPPVANAALSTTASLAVPSATAVPSASATGRPPAKKPTMVVAPPKKMPNCAPPYTIDADGVHIPKRECR